MGNAGNRPYLTRHIFRSGLECPVKLYYKALDYPENRSSLPFIKHVRNNRKLLNRLARCFHPGGNLIEESSLEKAFELTQDLLENNEITLFDPVFIWNRCRARIPILVKRGSRVMLYNIQTKAFDRRKHKLTDQYGTLNNKWIDYLHDIAFQSFIVSRLYPEWEVVPHLCLPDKTAETKLDNLPALTNRVLGQGNPAEGIEAEIAREEILLNIDVKAEVEDIWRGNSKYLARNNHHTLEEALEWMANIYFGQNKPPVEVGPKCKHCEFRLEEDSRERSRDGFRECWGEVDYQHVFDLIGAGTRTLIKQGIFRQEEVPEKQLIPLETIMLENARISELHRQTLQVRKAKNREVPDEIIKEPLMKEVEQWDYPLHFLDFEAGNYVVPLKAGRKPYQLLVFQFSCHTLHEDGTVEHHQWMHNPLKESYANYELVRKLKDVPGLLVGTWIEYSNFERNALRRILKELKKEEQEVDDASHLVQWLAEVLRPGTPGSKSVHISDMSRLVKNYYYNRAMDNSLSIKDVLKAVMTVSPVLRKTYSEPYKSRNFDQIRWWQWDREKDEARDPYEILQEHQDGIEVRRGTEAMVQYGNLLDLDFTEKEFERVKRTLLKYCELDTLAMLMIVQHWRETGDRRPEAGDGRAGMHDMSDNL